MKSQKPKKGLQWKQGYYTPQNPKKYIGKGDLIYRSSWEQKFCIYCDMTPEVIAWSIEPQNHIIQYISAFDNKEHYYNPDFYVKIKNGDFFKEYLIEIKPSKDLRKPERPKSLTEKRLKNYRYRAKTYMVNMSKYKYAKAYAKRKGMEFLFVTEDWIKKGNRL